MFMRKCEKSKRGWISRAVALLCASAFCFLGFPSPQAAPDLQVKLKASLSHPVMKEGEKQKVFLRVGLTGFAIEQASDRPPVNVVLVIDRSGSMSGEKIEKAKEAAIMVIERLNSRDIVSVVAYDNTVQVLVPATRLSDKEQIVLSIRRLNPGGTTALFAGVSKGAAEVRKFLSKEHVNRIILLSDGLANVGPQSPAELGKLGASLIKEGVSVSTIGLGLGYNEDLMSQLAFRSDGGHYFAEKASDLAKVFDQELGRATSVVAQEVRTEIRCGKGVRPVRILGREGEIDEDVMRIYINNLLSDYEKHMVVELEVEPGEAGKEREIASVQVRYDNMKTRKSDLLNGSLSATFTRVEEEVKKKTDVKVMEDAVEQIAAIQSGEAVRLRNAGKIDEARSLFLYNTQYLQMNSAVLESQKLEEYAKESEQNVLNLDDANWQRQGKAASEKDLRRIKQ
jgi:Ca-activated chloride channel family protein